MSNVHPDGQIQAFFDHFATASDASTFILRREADRLQVVC
jgi:hypothetical protein